MQQWVEIKNEKTGGVYYFNKIVRLILVKNFYYRQESLLKTNQGIKQQLGCKLKKVWLQLNLLTKCHQRHLNNCMLNRRITRLM